MRAHYCRPVSLGTSAGLRSCAEIRAFKNPYKIRKGVDPNMSTKSVAFIFSDLSVLQM